MYDNHFDWSKGDQTWSNNRVRTELKGIAHNFESKDPCFSEVAHREPA